MRVFCKECGYEFYSEGICEICPDCADYHIAKIEEFFKSYYEEEFLREQEILHAGKMYDYLFVDTYPMYRKLLERKCPNEPLALCINKLLEKEGFAPNAFFKMSRGEVQIYISRIAEKCYECLEQELRKIFISGKRELREETEDHQVQLFEVQYGGWCYAYLVDHHEGKHVAIMTDFYKALERENENLLLSTLYGKSYAQENPKGFFRSYRNGQYYIINTYLAFCKHARFLNREANYYFKETFYDAVVYDLDMSLFSSEDRRTVPNRSNFSYVIYKNVIIAYLSHNRYDHRNLDGVTGYAAC